MVDFRLWIVPAALATLAAAPGWAASTPSWTRFADCAAAYQANAGVSDPKRAATMTSQIADVARDYADAAVKLHGDQVKETSDNARSAVDARLRASLAKFSRQKREIVERYIEACPQIPE